MIYENLEKQLEQNFDETVKVRRTLHMYPELSFQEYKTRERIKNELESYGYENIETEVGGGAVLATIDTGKPGPTIGLRADFDGLPIQEDTELEFSSKNPGVMHACGHDAHTAILLSVAKAVLPLKDALLGKLIFIFQHAEEVQPGGAKGVVASGKLDDLDFVYGLHVMGNFGYSGKVGLHPGYALAASDRFDIEIQGVGGHGASPHTSSDSAVTAALLIQQLQTLVSRRKNPIESGVITISSFKAGEGAHNIIADKAFLKGSVRTFQPEVQELFIEEIKKISELTCEMNGATCKVDYRKGYPALYNDLETTAVLKEIFTEAFGSENVEEIPASMGGEDFAYYVQKFPGTFFIVPAGIPEQEINYPHHHPKFTVDERSLLLGGKAFAKIICHYLTNDVLETVEVGEEG